MAAALSVRLGTFTKSLSLAVAEEQGWFREAGLAIDEVSVRSSSAQFASLRDGEIDLALTGPDNVLAYQFEPANPLGMLLDLTLYGAVDRGFGLGLWCAPGLSLGDLRGRVLGVDVATSGFAFLAYELLRRAGLERHDVTIEALGSTPMRRQALEDGVCAATVLNASNELVARDHGCTNHGVVSDIGPYVGTVLVGRRGGNRDVAHQVAAIVQRAAQWLLDPSSTSDAERLAAHLLGLSPSQAREHLAVVRSERDGVVRSGEVDDASWETILALRQRFTGGLGSLRVDEIVDTLRDRGAVA